MARWLLAFPIAFTLASISTGDLAAETIAVVGWNTESGGADDGTLDDLIRDAQGVDLWGFSEVETGWMSTFTAAAEAGEGADFKSVLGTTGGGDRLLIVYDADRFDLVDSMELNEINALGRVRAPLVAHLRLKSTGQELLFMVNHLYRSRAEQRHIQSEQLNAWAAAQSLPVIAVGDYNYDWAVKGGDGDHDEGFDRITANAVFEWIRPAELVRTQCSSFNSVLDFVFASGQAQSWSATSEILERQPDYCPDDAKTSDHRPVRASFELNGSSPSERSEILQLIQGLQKQLDELRTTAERLPGTN